VTFPARGLYQALPRSWPHVRRSGACDRHQSRRPLIAYAAPGRRAHRQRLHNPQDGSTADHCLATVAIELGLFVDIYEIFLAGVLGTALVKDIHLSKTALALLLSAMSLPIVERMERKYLIIASAPAMAGFEFTFEFSVGHRAARLHLHRDQQPVLQRLPHLPG
jgi:hypothetical protein